MEVIILAGGKGTRLPRSARDIPKALVEIAGRPILAHQLERLEAAGLANIRLALGFRAEAVIAFLDREGRNLRYVIEPEPLGTGGAIRFASRECSEPFLVLHGDVLADFDYAAIQRAHEPGRALMVSVWRDDCQDYGLLELNGRLVKGFREKPDIATPGHINAGCYIFHPRQIARLPSGFSMLESDLFPHLAAGGELATQFHHGFWEDIGTEERLGRIRSALDHADT